jgi:antitoxin HigA-1
MACQHPGKILLHHYLEPRKVSQNALARAIKVPPRRINEIVHEKRAITADTAVRLSVYFGESAAYWLQLQSEYDIDRIKDRIKTQLGSIESVTQEPDVIRSDEKNTKIKGKIMRRIMR